MQIVCLSPGASDILRSLGVGGAFVEDLDQIKPDRRGSLVFVDDPDGTQAAKATIQRAAGPPGTRPTVYVLPTATLGEVLASIKTIGDATGARERARDLIHGLRTRIDRVALRAADAASVPRVLCLEALDPPRVAGRWMPELIGLAGGHDGLGKAGQPGRVVRWSDAVTYAPDVILRMLAGDRPSPTSGCEIVPMQTDDLPAACAGLAAVRVGRVYALDGALLMRAGPRLVDGLERLAALLHPDTFGDGWCARPLTDGK